MKLQRLRLKNFRQFYGEQALTFAVDDVRNVTVIHGFNGSGKTALLNAFTWCLYGVVSDDLERPDRLENERAFEELKTGQSLEVVAELMFNHASVDYVAARTRRCTKHADPARRVHVTELRLVRKTKSGALESVGGDESERQKLLQQMLPASLYPFFFFNGERVERLASPDAYDEVEAGVKTLLDVTIFERTQGHLSKLDGVLSKELKQFSDEELTAAIDEKESQEREAEKGRAELKRAKDELKHLEREIEVFERKQGEIAALADLTSKRENLRVILADKKQREQELIREMRVAYSQDGFLSFAEVIFDSTERMVGEARTRGDLPAKIKPQFVDDLLARKVCICSRAIGDGSPEMEALQGWRKGSGLAALEEAISQTSASLPPLRQRRSRYAELFERQESDMSVLLTEIQATKKSLASVEEDIGNRSSDENAGELRDRLGKLHRDRGESQARITGLVGELDGRKDKIDELGRKINGLEAKGAQGKILHKQIALAGKLGGVVGKVYKVRKDAVRHSLDSQVRGIWRDASLKEFQAKITDEFRLVLTKKVGGVEQIVVGASTGEKQVLAVSFVASLVRAAKQAAESTRDGKAVGISLGGIYPLVIDSPFGSLEDVYREKVASWIPKLADQLILMVSSTQWREEAERALEDRIGRQYVLELHTNKEDVNKKITLRGQQCQYVISERDPFEFTVIKEVE